MRKPSRLLLGVLVLIGFLIVGCTKYASQEQRNLLNQTKESALAAEDMLQQKITEREQWEKKVVQKEAELDARKAEQDKIRKSFEAKKMEGK